MNPQHTSPFTLVFFNAQTLPSHQLAAWQALVTSPDHAVSLPSTPLFYAFVETGHTEPRSLPHDWSCFHQSGPAPRGKNLIGGGGITLLFHSDVAVKPLPSHSVRIDPPLLPNCPSSSAVVCAIVRPKHCAPFLLAVVYLPPQCARSPEHLHTLTSSIDAASASHPSLPLLVVGDFNSHHADWDCPMATQIPLPVPSPVSACANELAKWITDTSLHICNPPSTPTRHILVGGVDQRSVIDLILTNNPAFVQSVSQHHARYLRSDHTPFTVELALTSTIPAPRPVDTRARVTWDHNRDAEVWQEALPSVLTTALSPLQPALLSLTLPPPAGTSPQALLDSVYSQFEQALTTTCINVVGTKVVRPTSSPWLSFPGVKEARRAKIHALSAVFSRPGDLAARVRLKIARREWRKVSTAAKRQCFSLLCEQLLSPDSKLRWSLLKRVQPSAFTSLTSIADPASGALPVNHATSLDNLCSGFIANGTPPPPANAAAHSTLLQQLNNPSIPPHPSDSWTFTQAEVQQQCVRQYTNTAPGPDAILPIFLKHAGPAVWSALSLLYSFSWTHAVTPQAWREANVMALYKGSGSKANAGSYRPISMTSIIIRTFEHLIHRRLISELEARRYFAAYQFGFRSGRSTSDAIHFLLTAIQRILRREGSGDKLQVPVLFLDIQKAFDRVDHAILLHRVQLAGITGKAWLWLRSFLSHRRMRCVDSAEHSLWQQVNYGVPQGCVLSPLLFLIFINDVQLTILRDPLCCHVSPIFFADDGAIGPNPFDPSHLTVDAFETEYTLHLTRAMRHLDDWCEASRMRFGKEKSLIVVFTTRKTVDETPYSALQLCGFTVDTASEYKYLGVYLTSRLSWKRAITNALAKAKRTSALVTRVALAARSVSFAAIRSLVLGLVLPSFDYGILFWGRSVDLPSSLVTSIQAQVATPLRVALSLPRTSHQLGTLLLCHVPTVSSLALRAQLSHLARVHSLPADHPTRRLHTKCIGDVTRRPPKPHLALAPSAALPLPVYLGASVLPQALLDPSILDTTTRTSLNLTPLPHWRSGVHYWSQTGSLRRSWAQANYPTNHLTAALNWSAQAASTLTRPLIGAIRARHTHNEWTATHAPAAPLPGSAPLPHATTAPLTLCMPAAALPPFLARRSTDTHGQQSRRARILMGRSRTGSVRQRFAKASEASSIDPRCTACSTPGNPIDETIPHMLLTCVRHLAARTQLTSTLTGLGLPLTLATILVSCRPPPPFPGSLLPQLLTATSAFLTAIHVDRAREHLVPLDTG